MLVDIIVEQIWRQKEHEIDHFTVKLRMTQVLDHGRHCIHCSATAGLPLVLDHGGNFDGDPISNSQAALLHQLLRHGPVVKDCVTKLDQLARLLQLDRILRVGQNGQWTIIIIKVSRIGMAYLVKEHGNNPAPLVENLTKLHVENVMGKNTRHWPYHHLIKARLHNLPILTQQY